MKVNLGIELTDEQRNILACVLADRGVKRLASRNDVREFLSGVVCGMRWHPEDEAIVTALTGSEDMAAVKGGRVGQGMRVPYSPDELRVAERLKTDGKSPEYIRGWIGAGRALGRSASR